MYIVKACPNRYKWNFLTPNIQARTSLTVIFSALQETNLIGFSDLSFNRWARTAPIPYGNDKIISNEGSKCTSRLEDMVTVSWMHEKLILLYLTFGYNYVIPLHLHYPRS